MRKGSIESIVGRVNYFLMPAIFIALLPIGLLYDLPWLGIVIGAIVVPLIDEWIGPGSATRTGPSLAEVRFLLVALLAVIGWSLFFIRELEIWPSIVLAAISSGYILGAIGIPAAHELGHRRFGPDRWLGQFLLACIGYGHYQGSHSRHHVRACLPDDAATARREESLWGFFPRYVVGIWRDATEAAAHVPGLRRHKPIILLILSVLLLSLVAVFVGIKGIVFWLIQALVGFLMIGSVDYIQHWGLRRKQLDDGHYERQTAAHTWESHYWLSERTTFNLTRHSFHHLSPGSEASHIERVNESPQMPLSYSTMVLIATIPPLFRKIMVPRLPSME